MTGNKIKKWLLGGVVICGLFGLMGCGMQSESPEKQADEQAASVTEDQIDTPLEQTLEMQGEEMEMQTESVIEKAEQTETTGLQDLQLSILGDSISTFEGYIPEGHHVFYPYNGEVTEVEQTWWKQLLTDTGMELCSNASSSGSTCAGDSTSMDNPQYGCSDYRVAELVGQGGVYPDVIIVYMGTNDLLTGVPIGENDGTQYVEEGMVENFSDAYCMMLDKLTMYYPGAQIFCCTLPPIGDWGTEQPFITFVNGQNLTSAEYSEVICKIATAKDYPVIDLQNCGITIDNMQQFVTDGVHLNPDGMFVIKEAIKKTLEEYY